MKLKELLTLRSLSAKLAGLKIESVKNFLERCKDPAGAEEVRVGLGLNVTSDQWLAAVEVVKEIFK